MKTITLNCNCCHEDVIEVEESHRNSYCKKCVPPINKDIMKSEFGYQEFTSSEYMVVEMMAGHFRVVTLGTRHFDNVSEELGFWQVQKNEWIPFYKCRRVLKFKTSEDFVKFLKEHRSNMHVEWYFTIMGEDV